MKEEVIIESESQAEELQRAFTKMFDRLLQKINGINKTEYAKQEESAELQS